MKDKLDKIGTSLTGVTVKLKEASETNSPSLNEIKIDTTP